MPADSPDRKVDTLRRMADVYRASRDSYARLDLAAIQEHTATLEVLSRQLAAMPPGTVNSAALAEIHRLNRAFAAMVKRSLHSANVMLNVIRAATDVEDGVRFHAYV